MEFKSVAVEDVPCDKLRGVTTKQLAIMIHSAANTGVPWVDLTQENHTTLYGIAARMIRDWPT